MTETYFDDWMISEELYNWIKENLPANSTILELGSGRGSELLAKDYTVYSVEQDAAWVDKFDGVNYIHAPLRGLWYNFKVGNLPKEYDLLIIDGPKGSIPRGKFMDNLDKFNLDAVIIVDDTNRKIESDMANKLSAKLGREVKHYESKNKKFSIL